MAAQKVRPAALRRFLRTLTYLVYAFAPEKSPGLAGRNFCAAIKMNNNCTLQVDGAEPDSGS
jgi:hypothetical protein